MAEILFPVLIGGVFVLTGLAVAGAGVWSIVKLRPRARAHAQRAVRTAGTVVGSRAGRRSRGTSGRASLRSGYTYYFEPVVEWTGPDGVARTQVPDGAPRTTREPATGGSIALAYDPQDLGWLGVEGAYSKGGLQTWGGAIAIVLGLGFATFGGGLSLLFLLLGSG